MIASMGLLEMFEVETPDGGSPLITGKQFRNRDNFRKEDYHSLIASNHLLPGFCFKRKADQFNFNEADGAKLEVYDISGNVAAQIPNAQLEFYQTGVYEYLKLRPHRPYNMLNLDGNGFLDDATYMEGIKPYTMPCGWYYYVITLTKNEGTSEKLYSSEIFRVIDNEPVTDKINLVENGNFENGFSGWNTDGTWSVSGGVATLDIMGMSSLALDRDIVVANASKSRYRIRFTITNIAIAGAISGIEVRVNHELEYPNIHALRLRTNGTYTFYADDINTFRIYILDSTFSISNISIEKVIGFEEMIFLRSDNECRGIAALPSTVAQGDEDPNYFDFTLLDASILSPEYGEELQQDENGELEKTSTFVRAFKAFDVSPMLLPEFVIDYLASLNTFDNVFIHDGKLNKYYALNTEEDETDAISVNNFRLKNQWQPGHTYGLINLSFDLNLNIKNSCCDEFEPCECDESFAALIQVSEEEGLIAHIEPYQGPSSTALTYPDCSLVELFVALLGVGPVVYETTGIVVSGAVFNSLGIDFQMELGNNYRFKVVVNQNGCFYDEESPKADYDCTGTPIEFEIQESHGPNGFGNYDVNITPTAPIPAGMMVQLYQYSSPTGPAECPTDPEDYSPVGSPVTSDEFNDVGIDTLYVVSFTEFYCYFVRIIADGCTGESDSNQLLLDL